MIKILFLAANPQATDKLRLDEEVRAIDEALLKSAFRDRFELLSHWAVRVDDLQELLLRHQPHIVHFSGHGQGTLSVKRPTQSSPTAGEDDRNVILVQPSGETKWKATGQIVLQNAAGQSVPVPADALSDLFRVLKDNIPIRCVVLNACYTQEQAEGIAKHIDCVVGMSNAILDKTAIAFSPAFYRGLGYGFSIKVAFDLGCSQIGLQSLPGKAIPQLIARTDANDILLTAAEIPSKVTADGAPAPGKPPYKGLHYFDTGDALLFFGREALTAELVAYLREHRFLAVVGASGSGKSSVVRAGLIPALQQGEPLLDDVLPPDGSAQWPVHIITPKAHPLRELAASLMRDSGSDLEQLRLMDELAEDARVLNSRVSRLLTGQPANRLLLVVDQFEELFTLCKDPAERKAFVDNLLTAAVDDGVTTVVITLRADFYAHCSQFDNLRQALESQQKYIGPMSRDELRRAIEEPARQSGWEFEPGLVDLLLHDVGEEPGALPLLSHALLETWKRRRGHTMTLAGYVESGRVQGAIAHTAESVFTQKLTSEQQAIAKNIFLRLTELGEGAEDTRRRVQLAELMPKAEEKATIETVLTTLADARLVTTDKDEVEVAHEALIRSWPTLRGWLDENREGIRIHRRLTEDAERWQELERDQEALYSGRRLEQAEEWERTTDFEPSPLEQAFLDASKARAAHKRRQRQLSIGAGIAAVVVLIIVLSGRQIIQQRNQATYNQLRSDAVAAKAALQPDEAIQKLTAANDIFPGQFDLDLEIAGVRRDIATAWWDEAKQLKADLQPAQAIAKLEAADELYTELELFDLDTEITDVRRYVATVWVQEGEELAKAGDYEGANTKFWDAINLEPPPDTPVYVWIEAGEFTMGEGDEVHPVDVNGFWIGRTEVTNAQYIRCVDAEVCDPPANQRYETPNLANHPVTNMNWDDAKTYAAWVGGRLSTEAEWEKACRGTDSRIYPWGNAAPTYERLNFDYTVGSTSQVGSYPAGAYGLYDMAGNVWEWTSSIYREYPYNADDGREKPEGDDARTLRGGSWLNYENSVRCAYRTTYYPDDNLDSFGFRVVVSSPGG